MILNINSVLSVENTCLINKMEIIGFENIKDNNKIFKIFVKTDGHHKRHKMLLNTERS